jgi:hypothetical protein
MLYLEILYASIVLLVMAVIVVVVYIVQFYDSEPLVTTKTPEEPAVSEPDKFV